MTIHTFTCEGCHRTLQSDSTLEEMVSELATNFGEPHQSDDAHLCDDCYTQFMAWFKRQRH